MEISEDTVFPLNLRFRTFRPIDAIIRHGAPQTVKMMWVLEDIGQLHMKWDNGRTLALVPGEDSFRKLTDAELREEQSESIAEAEEGPTLEM